MKQETLRLVVAPRDKHLVNRCVYCGARCYGVACPSHRDLIQIDAGMGAT